MKIAPLASVVFGFVVSSTFAQDPGFRDTTQERRSQAPVTYSGEISKGASVLNTMDVLDNSTPIQPGDVISLKIVEDRQEARQVPVGVTGEVNAPHIGIVKAAGRTSRELAFAIKRELEKSFYKTATVIVTIDRRVQDQPGYRTKVTDIDFFTVYGQVLRQGKYELPEDEDVTISQAILRAGGFAQFADPKHVKLVRKTPRGSKTILVNLDGVMRKGNLDYDIFLRPSDVIIVNEKKINF